MGAAERTADGTKAKPMSDTEITLDKLPRVIGELIQTVEDLKEKVNSNHEELKEKVSALSPETIDDDTLLSVEELQAFLPDHPARQTIYGWCSSGKIPRIKKGRKNLFRKGTIREWDAAGRPASEDSPESLAEDYLNRRRLENY